MIDERFEAWLGEASSLDRRLAVERLCEAFREDAGGPLDLGLLGLLERLAVDPSPKVRMALAEAFAKDAFAPVSVVRLLCEDIERIATLVVAHSPCLRTDDLLDILSLRDAALCRAIATRATVCERVARKIVESGDSEACRLLLANDGALIDEETLRQAATLAEKDGLLLEMLSRRPDLPADLRHDLVLAVARRLGQAGFVQQVLGPKADRVTSEACDAAALLIARRVPTEELVAFSDDLRRSGRVSTILLVRLACSGELDFFAAALAALSARSYARVRAMLVEGADGPLRALLSGAGVPAAAQTLLIIAVRTWKDAILHGADARSAKVLVDVLDEITRAFRQTRAVEGAGELSHILARLRAGAVRAMAQGSRPLRQAA